uniref:G-protein coupled receptors family 3 profile domain-containing protein n=1 Tax=Cyprinus carpio carpio TaxID=630221 RepID=A0A9J8D8D1_CYPCA
MGVWIASHSWAMNQQLPREPGIRKIGTIIGIADRLLSLPRFNEFVFNKAKGTADAGHNDKAVSDVQNKNETCNQDCDYCSLMTAEDIINESPTNSFAVYSAIYTIAHALHKVLQCDMNECHKNITVKPYMVPFSNCSVECKAGYSRQPEGFHSCCFTCKKWDPYTCFPCAESEWSDEGSTTCKTRSVVYPQFTEIPSIIVMISTACLIILLFAIFCLFAYNYDTPVVKSAGGSMCFLMLASLILSSVSVLFFFEKPTSLFCLLRNAIFTFFFTVCISCLTVRSFQIFYIVLFSTYTFKVKIY